MTTTHPRRRVGVVVLAASVVALAACANDSDPGAGQEAGPDADGVVRLSMAPDPVWDWLQDQGIKDEMEAESGIKILTSATWDEFGIYAGGHADVVSTGSWEVPDLVESTKVPSTVFGKYNEERAFLAVPADSDAETICDLDGTKFVTFSPVAVTLMWSMFASELCDGMVLAGDSPDVELVVTDIQNVGALVAAKEADGGTVTADFAIPQLRAGELKLLYEGRSVAQIFADEFGEGHIGPMSNTFVAPTAWLDANPEEAAFLLAVWERGIEEWRENRAEIITTYPEHFSVMADGDAEFIADWLDNTNDWFVDSVYLDDEWVTGERQIFDLMKEHGLMDEDADVEFRVIAPGS